MKRFLAISVKMVMVVFLSVSLFSACDKDENESAAYVLDRDTSYALGMFMANFMAVEFYLPNLQYDYDAFRDGFKALNEAAETRISWDLAMDKINSLLSHIDSLQMEDFWLDSENNRVAGEAYLAENMLRPEVMVTESGLQYEVIRQGFGPRPGFMETVLVHYEGTFVDGTMFDSSYVRGIPAELNLSFVIPGWSEGVQLMNVGSTFRFVIPSELAYDQGSPGEFPGNAVLIFQVELIDIVNP